MRGLLAAGLIAVVSLAAGCGPNCQSACQRIYNASECGLRIPGEDPATSLGTCIAGCEAALDQAGDLEGYDPFDQNTTGASISLDNEKQAALWMDCIETTECSEIDDGYCAPILPNP